MPDDMASKWYTVVIDAEDPGRLARWWADVLGYQVMFESPSEVVIAADAHTYPGLVFVPVPGTKTVKNRLHIDLNPDDQAAEGSTGCWRWERGGWRSGSQPPTRRCPGSCSPIPRATSSAC
jgi:hypothetical protein